LFGWWFKGVKERIVGDANGGGVPTFSGPTTVGVVLVEYDMPLCSGGTSWLCFPSYATITYLEFLASLSTCFLILQCGSVHL
jgi:hypothetical protein